MTTEHVSATAEGMPADPLIAAITAYHAGMASYDGREEFETPEAEQAAIAETYGPASEVLENWGEPATTRAGAVEALRFASLGCGIIGIDIQQNMIAAALDYFEQEAPASGLDDARDEPTAIGQGLSEMLKASEDARTAIDEFDGADFNDPGFKALCERRCELALAICAYRSHSDIEARRKVEFLRDWTECTPLTEEEQKTLFASMMPEGGEA